MQTRKNAKQIVACRVRCRRTGAGLSHYIMLAAPKKDTSK